MAGSIFMGEPGADDPSDGVIPRFKAAFHHAGVGIAVVDQAGKLVDVNPAFDTIVGSQHGPTAGRLLADLFEPANQELDLYHVVGQLGAMGPAPPDAFQVEARVRDSPGHGRWTLLVLSRIIDGSPFVLVIGVDITEQHLLRIRLRDQARQDPLTALANRAYLHEWVQDRARSDGDMRLGICFVDLDGFKQVNDHYGHGTGDRLLAAVADRFRRLADSSRHLLGRLGGDEFVVLIAHPRDVDEVGATADRMIHALAPPFSIDGMRLSVSASVGVAFSDHRFDLDGLLRKADAALYHAKRTARGTWASRD
ncbi:sensor domain-containing diguanylate cyclase [Asanoa sp. WMMD1127]|uniref:sensor domain-containing diguanylate cyclase n=1 Tax=Asanoa sp. WMMD1127 TaxID=3016107 RepID=UPI002415BA72|nr:sensor domain-containing diguanylate cyclase [Asanoa sp. WMMD1127]MDG4825666.1 sensor domain-containing diguanylate cyclase [Asanoa sp. WMMD1127]